MEDKTGSARWAEVKAILDAVQDLPRDQRTAYLDANVTDPELRREAEQLMAFDQEAGALFAITAWREQAENSVVPEELLEEKVLGSYRILREIGRGGMGAVYLAERADGAYEQQVALKVLQEGIQNAELEKRFRLERQILAGLLHPGIARLLDGGVTPEGRPFLVLEYVEGLPIDQYCEENGLNTKARLKLFQKVCDAVQAAHQQLVLHLDLKPANILVTAEGEPRLLDFGIARLVREADGGLVEPSVMMMTPRYASPEQAEGKPLGVGSDVFSLATLLYRLLTGKLPYPMDLANPFEAARMIREVEPALPSKTAPENVATELRGDLDTILMKGLRKEPNRRYPTVEAFNADITRYLEARPVLAHKDSFGYRAGKFLQRNRIGVAAAAIMVCIIAGSVASVVHSAIVARRERAAAERRLNDIQDLARFYVDDLFPSLGQIPGTLPVRQKMTEKAVEYLQSMSQERGKDPKFSKDLASGFYAMAMVQGFPNEPSLGDREGAIKLFNMARDMAERHAREEPNDPDNPARMALMIAQMSNVKNSLGDVPGAIALEDQAWETAQPVLRGPKSRRFMQASTFCFFHAVYLALDNQFNMADPEGALLWITRAEDLLVTLGKDKPEFLQQPLYISQLANVRLMKADFLRMLGRNDEARALFEEAMKTVDAQDTKNAVEVKKHQHDVHSEYAEFLMAQGELARAVEVSSILKPDATPAKLSGDPTWEKEDFAADADLWARLKLNQGQMAEGMASLRDSLAMTRLLMTKVPDQASFKGEHVVHLVRLAEAPHVDPATARAMFEEAIPIANAYSAQYPTVLSAQLLEARAHAGLSKLAQSAHRMDEQKSEADKAAELLQPVLQQRPKLIEAQTLMATIRKLQAV